jgi:hypothetical protein
VGTATSAAADDAGDQEHRLVYLLDGDAAPQYYLAPYYLVNDGDNFTLRSASPYSLVVAYGVAAQPDGSNTVTAYVDGGSGDYDFNWATMSFDSVWEAAGLVERGSGAAGERQLADRRTGGTSALTLEPGVFTVLVNVRDRRTGAFQHLQQTVYGFPLLATEPPDRAAAVA